MTVSLVGLTLTSKHPVGVAVNLAVWGLFAFVVAPALQTGVVHIAEARGGELAKVACATRLLSTSASRQLHSQAFRSSVRLM